MAITEGAPFQTYFEEQAQRRYRLQEERRYKAVDIDGRILIEQLLPRPWLKVTYKGLPEDYVFLGIAQLSYEAPDTVRFFIGHESFEPKNENTYADILMIEIHTEYNEEIYKQFMERTLEHYNQTDQQPQQ